MLFRNQPLTACTGHMLDSHVFALHRLSFVVSLLIEPGCHAAQVVSGEFEASDGPHCDYPPLQLRRSQSWDGKETSEESPPVIRDTENSW